jgi:hypothetical protein
MALGAWDLFVLAGKGEPRAGVVECAIEIPPGGVVTGPTLGAKLDSTIACLPSSFQPASRWSNARSPFSPHHTNGVPRP